MKNSILLLFILLPLVGFSQTIRILQGNADVTESTVIENIVPDENYLTEFSLYNSTDQKKTFSVTRILTTKLAPDYELYFGVDCMHFGPNDDSIFISSEYNQTYTIDAKATLPANPNCFGLASFFKTGLVCKDHFVNYKVWDFDHPTDVSEITIHYSCATSIHEVNAGIFSDAFPNPAASTSTINYSYTALPKKPSVQLYDLFGKLIREASIDKKEGSIVVDVADLAAGIYFYTFVADGKPIKAGKLMVANK